jgi:hypothetical protein
MKTGLESLDTGAPEITYHLEHLLQGEVKEEGMEKEGLQVVEIQE